ncbi:U4/U6 small nuclear ribonucleo protein PRP4 [Aspergillus sclerotioniger CBS 115572]|uniref:non-specific serine/threonine protein kinase n=1 Tax=Aspergillus sclerotioniger CBS 115572 TaxID=1450535 RepID=A0A317VLQ4_9EURO|nr:U4/U6 small nuclear ribonucleo protein PRP4 [Aspergillus sclerotioniger CBS 115572]PWY75276.1 U4/U6 small nuclear ribonucleo protein PRP4 [Aspergillus sclerotioniger CBS 115572]
MSSSQWASKPQNFPSSGFKLLDSSFCIEEETLPTYQAEKYYPVQQGEILNSRYQVLAKLGYGVTSTVWFARDLINSSYVALKIYVTGEKRAGELKIYHHLNSIKCEHGGRRYIRKLLDHFVITGPHGQHICLVHEPLGMSASELLDWIPGKAVTLEDMKPLIRQLLGVLDFLHSVAGVIHTDLQLRNLLLPTPEPEALSKFEEREIKMPSPRKVLQDRTIYKSSRFPPGSGLPLLSDFGEARLSNEKNDDDIMPNPYRAPEVILRASWDYKVDIWSVAMIAWDIVSSSTLIKGINSDDIFDDRVHLAELVALLGCPPPNFCERSDLSSVFWDDSGVWKGLAPIPDITFESLAANIRGEDKDGFLRWIRRALQWNPSGRPTALELLDDEWLMKGLELGKREGATKP